MQMYSKNANSHFILAATCLPYLVQDTRSDSERKFLSSGKKYTSDIDLIPKFNLLYLFRYLYMYLLNFIQRLSPKIGS